MFDDNKNRKLSIQLIAQNNGQSTNGGDIIVCNGADECPLKPEYALQTTFAEKTGIYCPPKSRAELNYLMEERGLTIKELRWAWFLNCIRYDKDAQWLVFRTSLAERAFATAMLVFYAVCILYFTVGTANGWNIKDVLGILAFTGLAWVKVQFYFVPQETARRARSAIEKFRQREVQVT
ncbi:MAG: hypothetical protein C4516_04295 [Oxalobacter sp.]|nr:MAG: hypothetical protein C4516_04295 [Oxalobacter sp.]